MKGKKTKQKKRTLRKGNNHYYKRFTYDSSSTLDLEFIELQDPSFFCQQKPHEFCDILTFSSLSKMKICESVYILLHLTK